MIGHINSKKIGWEPIKPPLNPIKPPFCYLNIYDVIIKWWLNGGLLGFNGGLMGIYPAW